MLTASGVDTGRAGTPLGFLGLERVQVPGDADRGVDGTGNVLGELQLDDRAGVIELDGIVLVGRWPEHELVAPDEGHPAELFRALLERLPVADPVGADEPAPV